VDKLARKLGDEGLAKKLIEAGYDTPRKIKNAKNADLERVVGRAGVTKVRAVLPKE